MAVTPFTIGVSPIGGSDPIGGPPPDPVTPTLPSQQLRDSDGNLLFDSSGDPIFGSDTPASAIPAASYLALVTSFHRGKPNFEATLTALFEPGTALMNFLSLLPVQFDLDSAVGVQLDHVGEWVGRTRYIATPLPNVYFSWGTEGLGWGQGSWRGTFDPVAGLTALDDDSYRFLLRAKIASNHWNGTNDDLPDVLSIMFPRNSPTKVFYQDNMDMSMTIAVSGKLPGAVLLALVTGGYIPVKPVGVRINYLVVSVDESPMFAWGVSNDLMSGWGSGAWGIGP